MATATFSYEELHESARMIRALVSLSIDVEDTHGALYPDNSREADPADVAHLARLVAERAAEVAELMDSLARTRS